MPTIAEATIDIAANTARLRADMAKGEQIVTRFGRNVSVSGAGFRSFGGMAQQAGFQIADFAVQVSSGTSALRAGAQQLPQFLGAFGPWGAVIGAAAAVLGAVVLQVDLFGSGAQTAAEKTAAFQDAMKAAKDEAALYKTAIDGLNEVLRTSKENSEANAAAKRQEALDIAQGTLAVQERRLAEITAISEQALRQAGQFDVMSDPVGAKTARDLAASYAQEIENLGDQIDELNTKILQGIFGPTGAEREAHERAIQERKTSEEQFGNWLLNQRAKTRKEIAAEEKRIQEANNAASIDLVRKRLEAEAEAMNDLMKEQEERWKNVGDQMDRIANELAGLINGTSSWSDVLFSILQQLLSFKFENGSLSGGIIDIIGALGSNIASDGIQFNAAGGPVAADRATVVGERGPELFVPGASGRIVPNHEMGGGGTSYTIIIEGDADEAKLDRYFARRMPGIVKASAGEVQRQANRTVGRYRSIGR